MISPLIPLGKSWVPQFLKWYSQLWTIISYFIEAARIKDITKERILHFFEVFQTCLEEYQITLENVYNMDETGLNYTIQANIRLCNWNCTKFICYYWFSPLKKVSSPVRTSRMGHSRGMHLCWWWLNSSLCYFQGRELMSSWIPKNCWNKREPRASFNEIYLPNLYEILLWIQNYPEHQRKLTNHDKPK